jgi:hypothetical protein
MLVSPHEHCVPGRLDNLPDAIVMQLAEADLSLKDFYITGPNELSTIWLSVIFQYPETGKRLSAKCRPSRM